MPAADLYLLPSDSESFGLSALEAQSCGVPGPRRTPPAACPRSSSTARRASSGGVGDVAGLADDGAALVLDTQRYETMARASRERAIRLFDAETIVSRYVALYERVLAAA